MTLQPVWWEPAYMSSGEEEPEGKEPLSLETKGEREKEMDRDLYLE